MADSIALPCRGQNIGRVGHAFHAAGHHGLIAAGQDAVHGQHGGLHSRAAKLINGEAAYAIGNSRADGGLPGGPLF